jgi:hypothetical protein
VSWAPDYTDVTTVRSYIRSGLDADNDAFIASWITATSRNVDDFCGRQFGNTGTAQARVYSGTYDQSLRQTVYEIDDIQNITGLTVTAGNQAQTSYTLWPPNAPQKGKPYTQLRTSAFSGDVTMSGVWGWTAIPAAAVTGLLLQAARLAKRRDSPFGVAGSPQDGSELRLLAQLDPDFRTTLTPLRRDWWAAPGSSSTAYHPYGWWPY